MARARMNSLGRLYLDGELVGHISDAPPGVADVLEELLGERDRLRLGLARIADGTVPGVAFAENDLISRFARAVLNPKAPE